jgi:hypothetical protein
MARILIGEDRDYPLHYWVATQIESLETGRLEDIDATLDNVLFAFGRLCDHLVEKGLLDANEVRNIVGYNKSTVQLVRERE